MPKTVDKKKTRTEAISSGDYTEKKMLLALPATIHSWVKNIADSTGMTQPNIVKLVLDEAFQAPTSDYVSKIKRTHAEQELKRLEEQEQALKAEKKRLQDLLG